MVFKEFNEPHNIDSNQGLMPGYGLGSQWGGMGYWNKLKLVCAKTTVYVITSAILLVTGHNHPFILWIEMASFHPCREWLWNVHPITEGLPNHWANESPGWYLVLTSRSLMKQGLKVMGCNSWHASIQRNFKIFKI
jgi:hypothetical protein